MPTFRNTVSVPSSQVDRYSHSQTSACKIQMPGNYPGESIQQYVYTHFTPYRKHTASQSQTPTCSLYEGVIWPGREDDHLPPFGAEVNNDFNSTSSLPYALMACIVIALPSPMPFPPIPCMLSVKFFTATCSPTRHTRIPTKPSELFSQAAFRTIQQLNEYHDIPYNHSLISHSFCEMTRGITRCSMIAQSFFRQDRQALQNLLHRISLTHPDECQFYMNTPYYAHQCADQSIVSRLVTDRLHRTDRQETQRRLIA